MKLTKTRIAAAIIAAATLTTGTALAGSAFDDVDDGRFYAEAVQWAKDNGITVGCDDGTNFCPDNPVTRGENVTFEFRTYKNVIEPRFEAIESELGSMEGGVASETDLSEIEDELAQLESDLADAQADADAAQNQVAALINQMPKVYAAEVTASGDAERVSPGVTVESLNLNGRYLVTFPQAVDSCILQSTVTNRDGMADHGWSWVRTAFDNEVVVYTFDNNDTPTDRAFDLLVTCNLPIEANPVFEPIEGILLGG
jgi:hypothetical protein